ncbi:NADP-dependent isocitrate dehydrogenase [Algoriphagus halophytocola]|uniref:Isocitrate dehydrogenase [NADP] n=1 Tax=Algoriphagus halophytocola TaxID=2991499 RepID=A0ABY6MPM8_9BACT|nr:MULTISPECIES: NADP-dependent isocitrate dehydrogenase [unclassified Algoriphagus]UZD24264.1 NADP-dependent isocitrate dehydrogenase [Algoriphagus sp. TR-M5]WBL41633.1 NADP-dependent isocitrate dehydrogenase [Algoriphagus sp. TR-M9]
MSSKRKITVAYGDGIGPEIMKATLAILEAAGAQLEYDVIEIGEQVYLKGISSGMEPNAFESLRETKVFLKAPITTPQGGGFKSLNVTTRTSFGLYANVRPCKAFSPFIKTHFPETDMVIIRENEEDLYAGIEHRQTQEVFQSLKLISKPGSEKIIRYAFEYAKKYGRKKVTCMTKDNIMKLADGLFHKTFDEVAKEYPDIKSDHKIIDIGTALIADRPETFDVVVTLNLYGDIISDVAAQVTGSVGLGGSANVGEEVAMFEAIHGSAPDITGMGIANPSGLLNGAIMMLVHIGQPEVAEKISNAWMKTLEDGIHTGDIYQEGLSSKKVGTEEFANAVIERIGQVPSKMIPAEFDKDTTPMNVFVSPVTKAEKELIGVDVFVDWDEAGRDPQVLGEKLRQANADGLQLTLITNRGIKVFPGGMKESFCTDHWRCRFQNAEQSKISHAQIRELLKQVEELGLDFVKTENLYAFDGVRGYSLAQGE